MTERTTKAKRRPLSRKDDARLARACVVLAEEIKRLAGPVFDPLAYYSEMVERMDDVIASMHGIDGGTALPEETTT